MKKPFAILIFVLTAHFLSTAAIQVESFTLANGLRVILSPADDTRAACVLLYHKTGVKYDPPEMAGVSFLYQNLMLLSTQHLDPYERLMFIERYGGTANLWIGYDNSASYQVVPDSEINNALWIESERIDFLNLTDREINIVKTSFYEMHTRRLIYNIQIGANDFVRSAALAGSVYQTSLYGSLEAIKNYTNPDIRKIYDRFRNPADIILVVGGKFAKAEVKKLIDQHYSILTPRRGGTAEYTPRPVAPENRRYTSIGWLRDNTPQNFVIYGIRAPSRKSPDYLILDCLRYHLTDARISRLEFMLNRMNRLNATIESEYTQYFDNNVLFIKISTPSRAELEKAKYVFESELLALQAAPLASPRVKTVKYLMELDFNKDLASLEKRCLLLAENFHLYDSLKFGALDFQDMYIDRIRKIKPADTWKTSKEFFLKPNLVVLNVYKKKG